MDESTEGRKWFKKKRFLIPGAFVLVGAIGSAGSEEPVVSSEIPAAVALADEVEPVADETPVEEDTAIVEEVEADVVEETPVEEDTAIVEEVEADLVEPVSAEEVSTGEVPEDVSSEAEAQDDADLDPVEEEVIEFETYDCNGTPLDVPVGQDGAELCESISSVAFKFAVQTDIPEVAERAELLDLWDEYEEVGRVLCSDFNPGSNDEEFGLALLLSWGRLDTEVQAAFNDDALVFAEFTGVALGAFCPEVITF